MCPRGTLCDYVYVFLGYKCSTTSVGSRQPWNVESCSKLVTDNNLERDLIKLLAIVKHTK